MLFANPRRQVFLCRGPFVVATVINTNDAHLTNSLFVEATLKLINNNAHMTNSLCVIATVMNTKDAHLANSLFVVTAMRNIKVNLSEQ